MLRVSKLTDYAVVVLSRLEAEGGVQTAPGLAAATVAGLCVPLELDLAGWEIRTGAVRPAIWATIVPCSPESWSTFACVTSRTRTRSAAFLNCSRYLLRSSAC